MLKLFLRVLFRLSSFVAGGEDPKEQPVRCCNIDSGCSKWSTVPINVQDIVVLVKILSTLWVVTMATVKTKKFSNALVPTRSHSLPVETRYYQLVWQVVFAALTRESNRPLTAECSSYILGIPRILSSFVNQPCSCHIEHGWLELADDKKHELLGDFTDCWSPSITMYRVYM